jgi:small conductance mechanosensitive channel
MQQIWPRIQQFFADPRLSANLVTFYGFAVVLLLASLLVRRLMGRWCQMPECEEDRTWSNRLTFTVVNHARALIFWITLLLVIVSTGSGTLYHMVGRDVRHEMRVLYRDLGIEQIYHVGLILASLVCLGVATELAVWLMRRFCPRLHYHAHCTVGCEANRDSLRSWFNQVQSFGVMAIRIGATWGAGVLVGLGEVSGRVFGFALQVLAIVAAVRLTTLAVRTLARKGIDLGNRFLDQGRPQRYWERVGRLMPFGESCVEWAIYVIALALCVRQLPSFAALAADYGPRIVHCIGLLFVTRVLIELVQVLLYEAFGLYEDPETLDAKSRTLVPLLQSVCQYVLYFGSGVMMLGMLGVNTAPILAGAGILGLAVGLGAQNLVTDVVSGFFILFENQYLVGDYVQIGDAVGLVEGVSIRLTQVRDGHGKLYIIPNGQIKGVVNYSKGFVNAVVDVRVPTGADLESTFRALAEAGRRLQQAHPKTVLAETHVQGLVELGTDVMTVRAVTKVQPGTHGAMQSEYRRMLKQVLDQQKTLPERPRLAA